MRIAVILLLLLSLPALACPFCTPAEADLFSELTDSQAVVLVQKVDTRKYKVSKILKGKVVQGRVLIASEPKGKSIPGAQLLLTTAGAPHLPYWSDAPRYLTAKELKFVDKSLAMAKSSDSQKYDFAAAHLESDSREIALSAYSLLAGAPLSAVQQRAKQVGVPRLISLVKDNKVPAERRALYLLMAIPSLTNADKAWIESSLFQAKITASSALLGPLVVAYLQVVGPSGVPRIEQRFLDPKLPATQTLAVTRALTLLGQTSKSTPLRNAIRGTFLKELQHPQRGGFAIAPLAVWGVYEAAPEVEKLVEVNPHVTWVKVAAIRFFRSFPGSPSQDALRRLAKSDPNLVKRTTDGYRQGDLGIE